MLGAGIGLPQLSLWNRKGRPALDMVFAQMGRTTLDPKITFGRTSNSTLTNSAGLVAYAPHNLLTYSEQFDNAAWFKGNTTVTANTVVAPNGTITADTLAFAAVANANLQPTTATPVSVGQVYTYSIYVKANSAVDNVKVSLNGADTTIAVTV